MGLSDGMERPILNSVATVGLSGKVIFEKRRWWQEPGCSRGVEEEHQAQRTWTGSMPGVLQEQGQFGWSGETEKGRREDQAIVTVLIMIKFSMNPTSNLES